ncbi:prealbumin-like fold domain-containing protein [Nannocystis pusilla]|uniref:Prealbumin-like fold domain-containing protein n=1 Tax=Nannocystis pusilla TaxID=889268 RepID=A0ABS7TRM4_9BACT|nr:SpaA isopeptide-forming pilin-related protein [Nannocystis pusilla]MBZ5710872.1 prealbumin-like fold domain-containing protein [Nannocystis pusilla]
MSRTNAAYSFVRRHRLLSVSVGTLVLCAHAVAFGLTGSKFEIDGNQIEDPALPISIDWRPSTNSPLADLIQNVDCGLPGAHPGCSGSKDDAFKGGVKEADKVAFAFPGIPPKDDLTRLMVYTELPGAGQPDVFLNLAFERQSPSTLNGDANIDFEINHDKVLPGNDVPVRKVGDALVAFNYSSGGGTSTIYLMRWIDSAAPGAKCAITGNDQQNRCWGACQRILAEDPTEPLEPNCDPEPNPNPNPVASARVNTGPLAANATAPFDGSSLGPALQALQFGEMSINLSDAGLLTGCDAFSSGHIKSRASTSINSQLKDIIKPVDLNISLCKTIKIVKTDDDTPGNPLPGAKFSIYKNVGTTGNALSCTRAEDVDGKVAVGNCTTGPDGTCSVPGLPADEYCVFETEAPPGYDLASPQIQWVDATGVAPLFTVNFIDPRQHKVFVYVCHEGTDTLHPSTYKLDNSAEFDTLAASDLPNPALETLLCSLLDGDTGYRHGTTVKDLTVNIPATGH